MHARAPQDTAALVPGRPIDDATVWRGADFPDDRSWVHGLDGAMVAEILDAARAAAARGIAAKDVTPARFPLPLTSKLIDRVWREVEHGPGFALLSGFPVDGGDEDLVRLAYCGLGSHFGRITVQNRDGEYLLEVTDKGKGYDRQSRGYHSTAHLDFHNDGTNTVTLLCMEPAAEGGQSMLVSGPAVYNAIVREAPQHLAALHRGFHHHRRDQREPGEAPVTPYRTPVFGFYGGLFHLAWAGPSIRFCEDEGVTITDAEKAALACFESVVERPELRVSMELRRGDLQLVNNFLVLHARTAYRDAPGARRRLLRLWLDDESSARLGPGKMDWYLPQHSRFTRTGGIARLSA